MDYQVIVDTDYILNISKNISDTSEEISNSINSLQKICDDLETSIVDQNIQKFGNNLSTYLTSLKEIVPFYKNMSSVINDLAKEYETVDKDDAEELKKCTINNEEGEE